MVYCMNVKSYTLIKEGTTLRHRLYANIETKDVAIQDVYKRQELIHEVKECNGRHVLIKRMDGADANALKDIASTIKAQKEHVIVFLASVCNDKVVFVAGADKLAVADGIKCGDLVKEAAMLCDGKGGGRADLAQAGGKDVTKVDEAVEFIKNKLS